MEIFVQGIQGGGERDSAPPFTPKRGFFLGGVQRRISGIIGVNYPPPLESGGSRLEPWG